MNRKELLNLGFKRVKTLTVQNPEYLKWVKRYTIEALGQDLGKEGDITTKALFGDYNREAKAVVLAKENGVIAGIEEVNWFYQQYGLKVQPLVRDGDSVNKGEVILQLIGPAKVLLETERTGLNLIQRMSGIATATRKLVDEIEKQGLKIMVAATRKTFWQYLDKKAVFLGGGGTHRLGLWESILIKDNHLEELKRRGFAKNYIAEALSRAWKCKERAVFIEIEVTTKKEAITAAEKFRELQKSCDRKIPCVIMLDNMSPEQIRNVIGELKVKDLYGFVLLEASGGINEKNIFEYAQNGVDVVSLGTLTHSTKALDINQEILI